ncbi:MAG: M20/M25/M40 family metallo-hydrolase [Erysipelotrichales bacterium]
MVNEKELFELLADVVKIESPFFREEEAILFVNEWFKKNGFEPTLHEYEDNVITNFKGKNVIGELDGQNLGPTILFNGHIDTVELTQFWTKEPYGATVEGNKMYGVGTLDMKSGVAAFMMALKTFKENHPTFNGKIKYQVVSDEEGPYGLGTNALVEDGLCDADVAIIPEPSSGFLGVEEPAVCLGARGGLSFKVEVKGLSAHAATPEKGVNAIVEASKIIIELEKLDIIVDDKLGKGSVAIIKIESVDAPASIADFASFSVFRHIVRGEDQTTVEAEIMQAAKNAGVPTENVNVVFRDSPSEGSAAFLPYVCDEKDPFISKFIDSVTKVNEAKPLLDYFPSMGDFNYIGSRVKIPTIVFGPRGANYHSDDEYVLLDSVKECSDIIYDYLEEVLVK